MQLELLLPSRLTCVVNIIAASNINWNPISSCGVVKSFSSSTRLDTKRQMPKLKHTKTLYPLYWVKYVVWGWCTINYMMTSSSFKSRAIFKTIHCAGKFERLGSVCVWASLPCCPLLEQFMSPRKTLEGVQKPSKPENLLQEVERVVSAAKDYLLCIKTRILWCQHYAV